MGGSDLLGQTWETMFWVRQSLGVYQQSVTEGETKSVDTGALSELLPAAVRLLAAWPMFGPSSTIRCVFAQFALQTVSEYSVPLLSTDALLNGSCKRGTDALATNKLNGVGFGGDRGCICPIPKLSQMPRVSICSMDSIDCALGILDHLSIGTGIINFGIWNFGFAIGGFAVVGFAGHAAGD